MDSQPSTMTILLLLMFITLSSAHDMSIISYDETHPDKSMSSSRTDGEVMALYEEWLVNHGKAYNSLGEKQSRFDIFKDNLRFIDQHNANQSHSFKVGLNRFADLTSEEYRSTYLGFGMKPNTNRNLVSSSKRSDRYAPRLGEKLPDSIDWRELGAVAPVKDQGHCGSCWAFSAISAVEGINKIVTGDLIVLSEQELVDCDRATQNHGCDGGSMDFAFDFIIQNGGIDTEQDYPYKGRDGKCNLFKKNSKIVSIDDYEVVPQNDESAMKKAVANQPVSVLIDSGSRSFMLYESGIYDGSCGIQLDHVVAVVGYGTENGKDYWIVRNSWGNKWGEAGYIRMQRNLGNPVTGKCGIAMFPCYPVKTGLNPQQPFIA